jgi:hypothetical protein
MSAFERALEQLEPGEAETLRRLDKRFALAQALLHKVVPGLDPSTPDYARVLLDFFDTVDMALDGDADPEFDDDDEPTGFNGKFHG